MTTPSDKELDVLIYECPICGVEFVDRALSIANRDLAALRLQLAELSTPVASEEVKALMVDWGGLDWSKKALHMIKRLARELAEAKSEVEARRERKVQCENMEMVRTRLHEIERRPTEGALARVEMEHKNLIAIHETLEATFAFVNTELQELRESHRAWLDLAVSRGILIESIRKELADVRNSF